MLITSASSSCWRMSSLGLHTQTQQIQKLRLPSSRQWRKCISNLWQHRFGSSLNPPPPPNTHTNTHSQGTCVENLPFRWISKKLLTFRDQVEKVLQLHLACVQRIGIIIVGPSGAGKSILWRILEGAYKHMGRPVKTHIMNPKAMHRQRLLGHMDMDTREMFDGVLTAASRQVNPQAAVLYHLALAVLGRATLGQGTRWALNVSALFSSRL